MMPSVARWYCHNINNHYWWLFTWQYVIQCAAKRAGATCRLSYRLLSPYHIANCWICYYHHCCHLYMLCYIYIIKHFHFLSFLSFLTHISDSIDACYTYVQSRGFPAQTHVIFAALYIHVVTAHWYTIVTQHWLTQYTTFPHITLSIAWDTETHTKSKVSLSPQCHNDADITEYLIIIQHEAYIQYTRHCSITHTRIDTLTRSHTATALAGFSTTGISDVWYHTQLSRRFASTIYTIWRHNITAV